MQSASDVQCMLIRLVSLQWVCSLTVLGKDPQLDPPPLGHVFNVHMQACRYYILWHFWVLATDSQQYPLLMTLQQLREICQHLMQWRSSALSASWGHWGNIPPPPNQRTVPTPIQLTLLPPRAPLRELAFSMQHAGCTYCMSCHSVHGASGCH